MNELGGLVGLVLLTWSVGAPFAAAAFMLGPMQRRSRRMYWVIATLAFGGMLAVVWFGWTWLMDTALGVKFGGLFKIWAPWILISTILNYWAFCVLYWFSKVRVRKTE